MAFGFAGRKQNGWDHMKESNIHSQNSYDRGTPNEKIKTVPCWLLTRLHFIYLSCTVENQQQKPCVGWSLLVWCITCELPFDKIIGILDPIPPPVTQQQKTHTLKTATNQLFILCLLQLLPLRRIRNIISFNGVLAWLCSDRKGRRKQLEFSERETWL